MTKEVVGHLERPREEQSISLRLVGPAEGKGPAGRASTTERARPCRLKLLAINGLWEVAHVIENSTKNLSGH